MLFWKIYFFFIHFWSMSEIFQLLVRIFSTALTNSYSFYMSRGTLRAERFFLKSTFSTNFGHWAKCFAFLSKLFRGICQNFVLLFRRSILRRVVLFEELVCLLSFSDIEWNFLGICSKIPRWACWNCIICVYRNFGNRKKLVLENKCFLPVSDVEWRNINLPPNCFQQGRQNSLVCVLTNIFTEGSFLRFFFVLDNNQKF